MDEIKDEFVHALQAYAAGDLVSEDWTIIIRPSDEGYNVIYLPASQANALHIDVPAGSMQLKEYVSKFGRFVDLPEPLLHYVEKLLRTRLKLGDDPNARSSAENVLPLLYERAGRLIEEAAEHASRTSKPSHKRPKGARPSARRNGRGTRGDLRGSG